MELGAQLAEVRRCHLEHHEREEHEAAQLASAFEACRAELASVQAEFQGLALLFEKERRSHAELRHMQRELEQRRIQRQRAEVVCSLGRGPIWASSVQVTRPKPLLPVLRRKASELGDAYLSMCPLDLVGTISSDSWRWHAVASVVAAADLLHMPHVRGLAPTAQSDS